MKKKSTGILPEKMVFLDYLIIFIGCLLYSLAITMFSSPNNIAPGGIIGISTVINYLFPFLPLGTMSFFFNIPIFIWGGIALGWRYLSRSLVATALSSVIIDIISLDVFSNIFKPYEGDMIIVSIFGGLICGTGLALIFYRGGSTGGTDIVSRIMHEKMPHVSMGNFMMMVDVTVIVISAIVYKKVDSALYALIFIFVNTKVIDMVLYGMSRDNGKLLFIVTSKYDLVCSEIMLKIDRGVTLLNAEGGYKRDDKRVLLCALRPQQVHKTSNLVKKIDPDAFIIITTANAIKGKGFPSYEDEEISKKVYVEAQPQNTATPSVNEVSGEKNS